MIKKLKNEEDLGIDFELSEVDKAKIAKYLDSQKKKKSKQLPRKRRRVDTNLDQQNDQNEEIVDEENKEEVVSEENVNNENWRWNEDKRLAVFRKCVKKNVLQTIPQFRGTPAKQIIAELKEENAEYSSLTVEKLLKELYGKKGEIVKWLREGQELKLSNLKQSGKELRAYIEKLNIMNWDIHLSSDAS